MQVCSSEDNSKHQYRPRFKLKRRIQTVLGQNCSHCTSHLGLTCALTGTHGHARVSDRRSPPGPARSAAAPRRSRSPPAPSEPRAPTQPHDGAGSPALTHTDGGLRSVPSSKRWRSKTCSQLCFLKDTENALSSILRRC